MNEATVRRFLNKFYDALQTLEYMKDQAYATWCKDEDEYDEFYFLDDTYDELFEWTNKIEIHYGLLND